MKGLPHMPSKAEQPPTPEPEEQIAQRSVLWGAVALLALLVLLTSLMSQQPDSSSGIKGVRLMPQLPEPVVYGLVGLFALGGIAVLAVLFPREIRFRRKKGPDEFQLYQEPPKFSFGIFVMLLPFLITIGLMAYLY